MEVIRFSDVIVFLEVIMLLDVISFLEVIMLLEVECDCAQWRSCN